MTKFFYPKGEPPAEFRPQLEEQARQEAYFWGKKLKYLLVDDGRFPVIVEQHEGDTLIHIFPICSLMSRTGLSLLKSSPRTRSKMMN